MQKKSLILGATFLFIALIVAHHDMLAPCRVSTTPEDQKKAEGRERNTTPLACNMGAMTPAQQQQHREILAQLRSAVEEIKELPDGYAFRFDAAPSVLVAAAEFITLESRCCPFFNFSLEIQHNGGPIWLRLTGPQGAKPLILNALGC